MGRIDKEHMSVPNENEDAKQWCADCAQAICIADPQSTLLVQQRARRHEPSVIDFLAHLMCLFGYLVITGKCHASPGAAPPVRPVRRAGRLHGQPTKDGIVRTTGGTRGVANNGTGTTNARNLFVRATGGAYGIDTLGGLGGPRVAEDQRVDRC
jgi:hypothetical protein